MQTKDGGPACLALSHMVLTTSFLFEKHFPPRPISDTSVARAMEGFEKHNLSMKKRLWESFELKPFVKVAIEGRKCPFHCNKRSQGGTNERNASHR